jgi:hypothetical protein
MDRLEQIARIRTDGNSGRWSALGWAVGLAMVLFGGIAVAASLLCPGLALAGSLPAATANIHPWIGDGGPEVAPNMAWRIEIMLEYLALGIAAIAIALRFGKNLLVKLQDWYEGVPLALRPPVPQLVRAVVMPRPGHGRARFAGHRDRKLHAV